MTNSEIRKAALAALKGKWWSFAGLTFVYMLVSSIIAGMVYMGRSILTIGIQQGNYSTGTIILYIVLLVASIAVYPMNYGFYVAHLASAREDELADPALLFVGYKRFWFFVGFQILMNIIIGFGFMILIVPGVIMALAYALWAFVAHDHPELSITELLERSRLLMQGHKGDLFLLWLNFIFWIILSLCTLGIALFFVIPYIYMATYFFYENIRYELDDEPLPDEVRTDNPFTLTPETMPAEAENEVSTEEIIAQGTGNDIPPEEI